MSALFACSKCNERFAFEELSSNDHLCKVCQKLKSTCSYCRNEFQLESKHSKESICQRCAKHVEKYGLPNTCKYCNLIAAFVGSKCERCAYKEKKYGKPIACDQCQQHSAFPKSDKMLGTKNLCWLCARSYKKLLTATAKNKIPLTKKRKSSKHDKKNKKLRVFEQKNRSMMILPKLNEESSFNIFHSTNKNMDKPPFLFDVDSPKELKEKNSPIITKKSKDNHLSLSPVELNTTGHFIMVTKLQEEIELLKKSILEKDRHLLEKDKKITQIKAENFENEKEYRMKIQKMQKDHFETITNLQSKNRDLHGQNSQLTRDLHSFSKNSTSNMTAAANKKKISAMNSSNIITFNSPTNHLTQNVNNKIDSPLLLL